MKTPLQAIRAKCTDCMAGNPLEISRCQIPHCPLYPYRFGRAPHPNDPIAFRRTKRSSERGRKP